MVEYPILRRYILGEKVGLKLHSLTVRVLSRFLIGLWLPLYLFFATSNSALAEESSPKKPDAKAIESAQNAIKVLQSIRTAIVPKTTSLEAMAETLNFSPNLAVDYVSQDIIFLPYTGSMRGVIGAMETGSASALDQALLLGGLLDIMGVEVILAYGTLNDKDIERLLHQSLKIKAPHTALNEGKLTTLRENNPKLAPNNAVSYSLSKKELVDRLDKLSKSLLPSLLPLKSSPLTQIRTDIKQNYVWVRYRNLPSDPWVDAHPAFSGQPAPHTQVKSYSSVEVPKERAHEFGFELILEVTQDGNVNQSVIAEYKPQQISQISSNQIEITIAPIGANLTQVSNSPEASYFTPLINGSTPVGAKAFSATGKIVPAIAAAGSGGASSSLFGGITTQIASKNKDAAAKSPYITGILLRAMYKSPLGRQIRLRPLVDFTDHKPGDVLSATDAMLRTIIDINIGETNGARDTEYQIFVFENQMKRLPYIMAVASGDMTLAEYKTNIEISSLPADKIWLEMAMSQDLFLPTRFEGNVVVPLTAFVSTVSQNIRAPEKGEKETDMARLTKTMDLMFTDTITIKESHEGVLSDREATLRLGVYRTLVETFMMKSTINKNALTYPSGHFETLNSQKTLKKTITASKISRRTSDRMLRDFESTGSLIVNSVNSEKDMRWWKLDQSTGEALGMNVFGGSDGASYSIILQKSISDSVSAGFYMYGVYSCFAGALTNSGAKNSMDNADNFKSCMAVNMALYFGGSALSGKIAKLEILQGQILKDLSVGIMIDVISVPVGNGVASFAKK